jgi:hypothetical protein
MDGKNPPQVRLAKDDDLIQAFAAERANQAFGMTILPWRVKRNWPVADAHRPDPGGEEAPVGPIIIADQVTQRRALRERFGNLLGQPLSRRAAGHLDPHQLPPAMAQDQKGE